MTPRRLLRASVLVALLTIVLKTLAWWLTGSVGLLSDALESFVNLAGAMFALAMVTVAERPADVEHPYGHHKAEYFSSGFEGILIVGASAAIVWASVQRLLQPQPLEQLGWGMALSLLSTGLNGVLAWAMFRTARQHRAVALEGDARHLLTDVWTSVGVVVGLAAAHATGWQWLDPVVGIAVGLNILREGIELVWRSSTASIWSISSCSTASSIRPCAPRGCAQLRAAAHARPRRVDAGPRCPGAPGAGVRVDGHRARPTRHHRAAAPGLGHSV